MKIRKNLERHGNGRSLRFTPELLHALGYKPGSGDMPVEVEVQPGRIVITSPSAAPEAVAPREALQPEMQALLVAVRDQGPANTKAIAEHLARTPPSTSRSLNIALREGWLEKSFTGWRLTDEARGWFAHVPSEPRVVPAGTRERILRSLEGGPKRSAELATEIGLEPSSILAHLRAGIAEGLVERHGSEYRLV